MTGSDEGPPLPSDRDLRRLDVDPAAITGVETIRREHGHTVYRPRCRDGSFVLKYFPDPAGRVEIAAYDLLGRYRVPTIAVHGRTTSARWRLATPADIDRPDVRTAVAAWYQLLHAAGRRLVADPHGVPSFLKREADALDAAIVRHIGERLQLRENPVWELAATHLAGLQQALRALPTTLTYGDFHWTNLALSRDQSEPLRAVVFDYHLLGIDPAYGDYRNVLSGLGEGARATFSAASREVDEREAVLDAPLPILYSLSVAVDQPRLPAFAVPLVQTATTGELERKLRLALATLPAG